MVDPAGKSQQPLGVGDVHEDQGLARGVGEGPDHPQAPLQGGQGAAGREAERAGKPVLDQDGPLVGEEGQRVLEGSARAPLEGGPGQLGADGPVQEGVDAQQPHQVAVFQLQAALQDGREGQDGRIGDEVLQDRLVDRAGEALEGVGGFAAQELHGLGEAREGRLRREGHADDGGHPAGNPEELQEAEAPAPVEVAKEGSGDGAQENLGYRLRA